uniref:Uncharacterized protein n=1 Tax=Rousettus aegyptiacus TaxID=9407 RepID=A0A7J8B6Z3_ROUAE|nr:hypothetical protein HJG63_010469 [Rousettus aegyptiacus]
MAAALPALVLVPFNADFLSINPVRASDPPLVSQVSVRRLAYVQHLGFHFPSFSSRWLESPLDFYSQSYWNLLFPGLGPWAGELPHETRTPPSPSGEPLQPRSPSRWSSTTHRCESSPIHDFAPSTHFDVAPSCYRI